MRACATILAPCGLGLPCRRDPEAISDETDRAKDEEHVARVCGAQRPLALQKRRERKLPFARDQMRFIAGQPRGHLLCQIKRCQLSF